MRCPKCQSEYTYYSRKEKSYICEDCGMHFDEADKTARKVFFSYGHDKNSKLVDLIKGELEKRGHEVWIDKSEIHAGADWRESITKGIIESDEVVSFMSRHSVRVPGVCLDELRIALCVRNADVKTVLLEKHSEVDPPAPLACRQWLDMSDWQEQFEKGGEDWQGWFSEKLEELVICLESPTAVSFRGDIAKLQADLRPLSYGNREHQLLESEFVGREWLFEKVSEWCESDNDGPFVLLGVPGSGKSSFASHLAHYNPAVVATVFFEYDRPELAKFDAVTRLLAFQLAAKLPDYRAHLIASIDASKGDLSELHDESLFNLLVGNPLRNCIVGHRPRAIVIADAVDELNELDHALTPRLMSCLRKLPMWVRLFITMRPEADLGAWVESAEVCALDADNAESNVDLSRYMSSVVEGETDARALAAQCEGSFLYAIMLRQEIKNGAMLPRQARELTGGLAGFYDANFSRRFREEGSFEAVLPALELMVGVPGITRGILREAAGMDAYAYRKLKQNMGAFMTEQQQPIAVRPESFISSEVRAYKYSEEKACVLGFSHKSLYEWLMDSGCAGRFWVDASSGQRLFSRYALNLVLSDSFKDKPVTERAFIQNNLAMAMIRAGMCQEYLSFLNDHFYPPYLEGVPYLPRQFDVNPLVKRLENDMRMIVENSIRVGSFSKYLPLWSCFETLEMCLPHIEFTRLLERIFEKEGLLFFLPAFFRHSASDCYSHQGLTGMFNFDKIAIAHAAWRCYEAVKQAGTSHSRWLHQQIHLLRLSSLYYEDEFDGSPDGIIDMCANRFDGYVCELDAKDIIQLCEYYKLENLGEKVAQYNTSILARILSATTRIYSLDDAISCALRAIEYGADYKAARKMAWGESASNPKGQWANALVSKLDAPC